MKLRIRLAAIGAASVLLLAACGGGESSSRTKNSALCYATQEDKDAAVQAAQDAFDAAMGGAPTDDSIAPTDSTVVTDTTVTPEDSDVVTDSTSATGGGYRRPAVRAASSGDTTVPPAGDGGGEGDGTLTPEQQQAQMDLETAESQPLCDESSESADQVTCTATIIREEATDDCEQGDVRVFETDAGYEGGFISWELIESGTENVFAQGEIPLSEMSDESGSAVPYTLEISYSTNSDSQEESDAESEYEFSGEFAAGGYYFHEPRQGEDTVITATTNASCEEAPFSLEWYIFNGISFEYSSTDDGANEDDLCSYDYIGTYSEAYIVKVVSDVPVQWGANVQFEESSEDALLGEPLEMIFSDSFDSEKVFYSFSIENNGTPVQINANTGMSCERRAEIVPDPEIKLYGAMSTESDLYAQSDNEISDDESNCSAAEIWQLMDAGDYLIEFANADYENPSERGTININSSIELVEESFGVNKENSLIETISPVRAFAISIPEGGGRLTAIANSQNTEEQCDGDLEHGDPYLILVNLSTSEYESSDDEGEDFFGLPCYSSYLREDLSAGQYLLIASNYAIADEGGEYEDNEILKDYELELNVEALEDSEEVVVEESNEPIPAVEIPSLPALPVGQLVEPGSKSTVTIGDDVSSMVCDKACIDELFANVDASVSTLELSIGRNTVQVNRNAKKAVVKVEAGSRSINVATVGEDESTTKILTGQVQMGEPEVLVSEDSSSERSSMSMILIIVLGLIVVGGAGAYVLRKRSAAK